MIFALGSKGPEVSRVHQLLVSAGHRIDQADLTAQLYGESTVAAVKEFQNASGLDVDGVVGPVTMRRLIDVRLVLMGLLPPPVGLCQIREYYGSIILGADPQGGFRIISPVTWEVANLVRVTDLPGLPGRTLTVHRRIEAPLRKALELCQQAAPRYEIKSIGCFNPRYKRSNSQSVSIHAWAAAVDINPAANPMRLYQPGEAIRTDMPPEFVEVWESCGWTWGGRWRPRADAMHFQYASGY